MCMFGVIMWSWIYLSSLHFQRVNLQRILPALFKEAINPDMVPFLLPSILMVAEQANESEYKLQILPQLIPLFNIKEPVQVCNTCSFSHAYTHACTHTHIHTHTYIYTELSSHTAKIKLIYECQYCKILSHWIINFCF